MTNQFSTATPIIDLGNPLSRSHSAFIHDAPSREASVVSLITDVTDSLLDDYARLLAGHSRAGNIFQQRSIAAAVQRGMDRDHPIIFAVIRRGGEIASILPLKLTRHLGVLLATDLVAPVSQYSDIVGEPLAADDLATLTAGLHARFRADALLLRRIRDDSGLAHAFRQWSPDSVTMTSAAPFIDLAAYGSFAAYAARFGKKTSRMRKQRRQKLEEQHGPLRFATYRGAQAGEALAAAVQWKRDWLAERRLSSPVFDGGDTEALLYRIGAGDALCVSVLSAGTQPVAIEVGFVIATHYAAYLGAFDPAFAKYSPGQEQMLRTLEWCFAQGFSRYDLLAPDDDYKLAWTETKEPVRDYCVALTSVGSGYGMLRRLAQSRKSLLQALPEKARRYGTAAVGVGAAATIFKILAE